MKIILSLLALVSTCSTLGQEITLKGKVTDTTNGRWKINIYVTGKHPKYTAANPDGTFNITALPKDSIKFSSHRHKVMKFKVEDLAKIHPIAIKLEPGGCVESEPPCEEKPILYVFVGKKIDVDTNVRQPYYCDFYAFDSKYQAKYEVLENVYGNYPNNIIEFIGYEHAMPRSFYDYKYVMLYVADYCGTLIHLRYMYDPLYKTKDNKWASPYSHYNYKSKGNATVEPRPINFKRNVKFSLSKNSFNKTELYPEVYYELDKDYAIAKFGNYPEELFELKKSRITDQFNIFID